jgi:hypothetical protein
MLISHYLLFENNYVALYFNYGMLSYVTTSTSSWYVSMFGFMEKNKDDDDIILKAASSVNISFLQPYCYDQYVVCM